MKISVKVIENIDNVKECFWKLNQASISSSCRTKGYLKDSQQRLGDQAIYFECYIDEQPFALLPIVIFRNRSTYSRIDPHEIVKLTYNDATNFSVAYCVPLFNLGCPILSFDVSDKWNLVMGRILSIIKLEFKCKYFLVGYLSEIDNPLLQMNLTEFNIKKYLFKTYGIIDVTKFKTFDEFLISLSRNRRRSYRVENKMYEKQNIHYKIEPINKIPDEILGTYASNVYANYGTDVPPERLLSFAKNTDKEFEKSGAFVAYDSNEHILSYAIFTVENAVLDLLMFGKNYDLDKFSSYFLTAYHAPIKYAIDNKLQIINYGSGSTETKVMRGCKLIDSFVYVFKCDT